MDYGAHVNYKGMDVADVYAIIILFTSFLFLLSFSLLFIPKHSNGNSVLMLCLDAENNI